MVSSFLFIFAGMEKIYNYYQDIVTAYTRRADNLKKKIHLLGSIRLLLVASLIARLKLQMNYGETHTPQGICEGAAWLSSARAVRCRLKCHNERNPRGQLLTG